MGSGGIAAPFLTPALDGEKWLASRIGLFIPGGKSSRCPLIRRLWGKGKRAGLDAVE
jgi:hypothetical protein